MHIFIWFLAPNVVSILDWAEASPGVKQQNILWEWRRHDFLAVQENGGSALKTKLSPSLPF